MDIKGYNYKRTVEYIKKINETPLSEIKLKGRKFSKKCIKDLNMIGLTNWCFVKMFMSDMESFSYTDKEITGLVFEKESE